MLPVAASASFWLLAPASAPASTARIRSRIAIAIAIANVSNNDIEFCGQNLKVGRESWSYIYLVTVLLVLYMYKQYTMIMAPSLPVAENTLMMLCGRALQSPSSHHES